MALGYLLLTPPTWTCKSLQNSTCRVHSIRDRNFTERRMVMDGENRLGGNHTQTHTFYLSLSEACRRARPSTKEIVHPQQERKDTTCDYNKCSRHSHTSRRSDQHLSHTRIEWTVIERKWYATVTQVANGRRDTVRNRLSPSESTAKGEHELWILHPAQIQRAPQ